MRPPLFTVGDDTAQTPRGGGEAGGWAGGGRRVWEEQGGKERKDDAAAEEAAQCLQQQREGEGNGNGSETGGNLFFCRHVPTENLDSSNQTVSVTIVTFASSTGPGYT